MDYSAGSRMSAHAFLLPTWPVLSSLISCISLALLSPPLFCSWSALGQSPAFRAANGPRLFGGLCSLTYVGPQPKNNKKKCVVCHCCCNCYSHCCCCCCRHIAFYRWLGFTQPTTFDLWRIVFWANFTSSTASSSCTSSSSWLHALHAQWALWKFLWKTPKQRQQ